MSKVAKAALGESNIVMKLRDELGTLYRDSDFTELFSHEGQPGVSPWRLAMVCVLQYLDNLSDRGAIPRQSEHVLIGNTLYP